MYVLRFGMGVGVGEGVGAWVRGYGYGAGKRDQVVRRDMDQDPIQPSRVARGSEPTTESIPQPILRQSRWGREQGGGAKRTGVLLDLFSLFVFTFVFPSLSPRGPGRCLPL